MASDRQIHARTPAGTLIVRYDRAGKWFMESDEVGKRPITLDDAVRLATQAGSYVYLNQPGGKVFDSRVRKADARV